MIAKKRYACESGRTTVELIGSKWKLLIIRDILTGAKRFCELRKSLEGISKKVLTYSLREMEQDGILIRTVFPEVPPRVEYSLSELVETLRPVMDIMAQWAMDFVSDQLYHGKRFRTLTIIDVFTRECLDIYADKAITGERVTEVLDRLKVERGVPQRIKVDNGPEFISKSLEDARDKISAWKKDYNEFRPHSGLTHQTPADFACAARLLAV